MAVTANYNLGLTIDETVTLSPVAGAVTFTNTTATAGKLDASTTVPATKCFNDTFTLGGAAITKDLTALAYTSGELDDVNFDGLHVQLFKVSCPSTNATVIILAEKAGTPWNPWGPVTAAGDQVTISPGSTIEVHAPELLQEVAAANKDIEFTGATPGDYVTLEMVAG